MVWNRVGIEKQNASGVQLAEQFSSKRSRREQLAALQLEGLQLEKLSLETISLETISLEKLSFENLSLDTRHLAGNDDPLAFGGFRVSEVAVDAYTYAYPMILMDVARRSTSNVQEPDRELGAGAPINEFTHLRRLAGPACEHVVHPNPDVLYSSLWFDVSREPLLVSVPNAGGRFFSLSLLDHWSDVFAAPGVRTTGASGQTFAIVGPSWSGRLPPAIREYRSPTVLGWLVAHTEVGGTRDLANVARFQAGLEAAPLSHWGQPQAPVRPLTDAGVPEGKPAELVARMRAEQYFERFCELTRKNPPHPHDYPLLDRMRRIGIVPGRHLDFARLPSGVRTALEKAPLLAVPFFKEAYQQTGQYVNYWHASPKPRGVYGTDYAVRAGVAYAGFEAHANEESASYRVGKDGNGDPFDSSLRYTLTFSKYTLPPARAFWSLSLYNERQRLAANSLNRYSLGDRDELAVNADGSITLYIQRVPPGGEHNMNWLPAPRSGGFNLDLRLYWPSPDVLTGRWHAPVVHRVE
jgi:hypothetical protein